MKRAQRLLHILAGSAMLCVHPTIAASVTVTVHSQAGVPVADAIVVFDPVDTAPAAAHLSASIDQIDKKFVPRITVIRTGTAVTFPNSDRIRHQVYSFSKPKVFTLKLYAGLPAAPVTFDTPGMVVLGCNIHDKMTGFVAVVDSPYFAKSDATGAIGFTLPAGRYRLRAWHPNLAEAAEIRELAIGGSAQSVPVQLNLDAAANAAVPWPE